MSTEKRRKTVASGQWLAFAVALALFAATSSQALTVLSGPTFAPSSNAPLAGVLSVTTDVGSYVTVSVKDGAGTWHRDFSDDSTHHAEILLGFKPNRTNAITVTVRDEAQKAYTVSQPLTFVTGPLPRYMPAFILRSNDLARMEPGYTIFKVGYAMLGGGYVTIVDNSAQVVWYAETKMPGGPLGSIPTPLDGTQLPNGDLLLPEISTQSMEEVNMLGQKVQEWWGPFAVDPHETLATAHGTILYLNYNKQKMTNFPTSATDAHAPTATADVTVDRVVEIPMDHSPRCTSWALMDMLDPNRINYLCFLDPDFNGIDPQHANSVIEDPKDNSIIVSLRHQDAVVKFTRAGQVKWILGPHENWGAKWRRYLLTPVGSPFAWSYGQHAPVWTPQGTLLLFDNGNCRAEPFAPPIPDKDNYSRAVEYKIDEMNMTVSQVWEYADTNSDRLYSDARGNAQWLPQTGHVLVTFANVSYENGARPSALATNAVTVRIKEVTHEQNPSVVFDLELFATNITNPDFKGFTVYRSFRIRDLYGQPSVPGRQPDRSVQIQRGAPGLYVRPADATIEGSR